MDPYLDYTLDETIRWLEGALTRQASLTSAAPPPDAAQPHASGHDHGRPPGPRPRIFLEKGPASVRYQLNRLSAAQLLTVDRAADDPKYQPVYAALLVRPGLSAQDREEAVAGLTALNKSEPVDELLLALGGLDWSKPQEGTVVEQLATLVMKQPAEALARRHDELQHALSSRNAGRARRGLCESGREQAGRCGMVDGQPSVQGRLDFLAAVRLVPDQAARAALRDRVVACLDRTQPTEVRRAAVEALASIPAEQADSFHRTAGLVAEPPLRTAAVRTLDRFPREARSIADARQVVRTLVDHAESTPAARRTTADFLDAMHLTDELLALLPVNEARGFRDRLRKVTVRVVRINTVHEEMRYDTPYFAVEAGRPVQLVLRNEDLMPHNLVVTAPGALRRSPSSRPTMPPVGRSPGQAVRAANGESPVRHPDDRPAPAGGTHVQRPQAAG